MASQERDIEQGPSTLPKDDNAASIDARSVLVTPPPGAMYNEQTRSFSPVPNITQETAQRPPLISISSTMSMSKVDPLERFRNHLGIHRQDDLRDGNRVAANMGIYHRVVAAEKSANAQYKIFSTLINGALGLQIIFAAALTALGAGNGPRSAVTAFGAMNTILAGFLTFLKGSGLPNRLKYYENEWTKVREYIEQRERDFAHSTFGTSDLNLMQEIDTIERMYENVRRDIETNTPDSYISSTKTAQYNRDPLPSLARNLSLYSQKAQDRMSQIQHDVRDRYSQMHGGIDERLRDIEKYADDRSREARDFADDRLRNGKDYADSRVQEIRSYVEEDKNRIQNQVQVAVNEVQTTADARIQSFQQATEAEIKKVEDTIHEGERKAKDLEQKLTSGVEKVAGKVLQFIDRRKEGHDK